MKTAHSAHPDLHHEPAGIFGDPWNEPATAASGLRMSLVIGILVLAAIVFAATAAAWVSDFSSQGAQPQPTVVEATAFTGDTRGGTQQSPVPVLAPGGMTAAQSEEFARRFRATPDGYFARVSFGAYDVVVNGSTRRSGAGDSAIRISETETGLAAMFSRAGADYQVEFSCRGPGSEAGARCITEDQARAFVAALIAYDGNAP
jgi:hypothetical protein